MSRGSRRKQNGMACEIFSNVFGSWNWHRPRHDTYSNIGAISSRSKSLIGNESAYRQPANTIGEPIVDRLLGVDGGSTLTYWWAE